MGYMEFEKKETKPVWPAEQYEQSYNTDNRRHMIGIELDDCFKRARRVKRMPGKACERRLVNWCRSPLPPGVSSPKVYNKGRSAFRSASLGRGSGFRHNSVGLWPNRRHRQLGRVGFEYIVVQITIVGERATFGSCIYIQMLHEI